MRGDAALLEKSGRREDEGTGADTRDASRTGRVLREPSHEARLVARPDQRLFGTAGHQDRVELSVHLGEPDGVGEP